MAGFLDRFRRKKATSSVEDEAAAAVDGSMDLGANEERLKRQRIGLLSAGAVIILGTGYWILGEGSTDDAALKDRATGQAIRVSTDDLAGRNLSEQEWISMSENRLQTQDNRLRSMQGQGDQIAQMQEQINRLQSENGSMAADGTRVVSAYETENQQLRSQLAAAQSAATSAAAGPRALYGVNGPAGYQAQAIPAGLGRPNELKVISFGSTGAAGTGGTPAPRGTGNGAVESSSINYLPANSFARARVIVGVDASSNVSSQSDPSPVVLRIIGPARSVADRGKILTTKLEGCLVNGAARGDLSSEKVYVRLAKMTCPVPGGRFAESEVKGFIAFGGKTGVRGRVVSREGSLATQAFMAGLVGGIGRGVQANTQGVLNGSTTVVNGQRQKLSPGEIAGAGFGEGVSQAGDMVSQYLIERAEQYQPVIEMPTGIEVEIVFLEGLMVRN